MIEFFQRHIFTNKNQLWTFWAQISRMLAGIVFVVLITRSLSTDSLATWYVFIAVFGLVTLGEMGLSTVYARHFVYIRSDCEAGKYSQFQFADFIRRGERYYFLLAAILFLVSITIGTWFLYFKNNSVAEENKIIYWLLYSFGGACSILSLYYAAVINGMGEIWRSQRLSIFSVWINSVLLLLLLFFKDTLLIPVCAYAISQVSAVFLYRGAVVNYPIMETSGIQSMPDQIPMAGIWADTFKTIVGMIAYQGLTSGFFLIISRYSSPENIASYGLTMQFSGIVTSLSMVWASTAYYEMAANRGRGKNQETLNTFKASYFRSSAVCFVGFFVLYFVGPSVLKILGSRTDFLLGMDMLVLLGMIWLEFNYGLLAQLLISQGELRVSYIAALGAVAVCGITFLLSLFSFNLLQVFAARLCCAFFCFGVPYLFLSWKMFRFRLCRIKGNSDEIIECLRADL